LPIWAQEPTVAQVSTMVPEFHVGADVDVTRHQDHVRRDVAASVRGRGDALPGKLFLIFSGGPTSRSESTYRGKETKPSPIRSDKSALLSCATDWEM
jgi:hypothetical protein